MPQNVADVASFVFTRFSQISAPKVSEVARQLGGQRTIQLQLLFFLLDLGWRQRFLSDEGIARRRTQQDEGQSDDTDQNHNQRDETPGEADKHTTEMRRSSEGFKP